MTELGQQFVEALRAQGYNLTFDAEDLIIHREGVRLRVVPLVGLREPGLAFLLDAAITAFTADERGRFVWPPRPGSSAN